jgi:hypothetical protein
MAIKVKRTYNLTAQAVAHVRDLAAKSEAGMTQDGVVELAIERLYRERREHDETAQWARASEDPAFIEDMKGVDRTYRDLESWPAE